MLHKTRAIVLNYIRYRETSIIVKAYTEEFGLQSYIVNGVRTPKGHLKIAYYQPLSLLSLVAYHRQAADLNRISQVAFFDPTLLPSAHITKTALRMFISEVLGRALKEEEHNPDLFEYIFTSLLAFEHAEEHLENFHIQFLIGLSRYLGFGVTDVSEMFHQVHHLENRATTASGLARADEVETLQALLELPYFARVPMPALMRRDLLEVTLKYFRQHVADMPEIRSLEILKEVFS